MKDFIKPLEIIAIIISLMIIPHLLPKSEIPDFMRGTIQVQNTNKTFRNLEVEFAISDEEKNFGLMYRRSLLDIHGMFFIYKTPQIAKFWMKNTLIPLDMLWLDEDLNILHIQQRAQPCSPALAAANTCPIYEATALSKYVFEIE